MVICTTKKSLNKYLLRDFFNTIKMTDLFLDGISILRADRRYFRIFSWPLLLSPYLDLILYHGY
jgi:hypothetical protein